MMTFSYAQNITIKGKADSTLIGKEVVLSDYSDYITYTKVKESSDIVDKNGFFELKIQSNITKPVLINIENLVGKIYIQPNFVYGIFFPGKDSLTDNQEGTETLVDIGIYGKDSTELNALITDFNNQYNNLFTRRKDMYLSPAKMNMMFDTFLVTTQKRYKNNHNSYFKSYVNYSFADFYSSISKNEKILYKQFISNKTIMYSNYEYMKYFNIHFKGYLKAFASTKSGGNIYNSINSLADYKDLQNQFRADLSIKNDSLRELVILKGLYDFYYSADFDKRQVQSVIEQLQRETTIAEHKKIATQILQSIYQLQPGALAPDFTAKDKKGLLVDLSSYKGKHIYLNFFSAQSDVSLKEMQKIIDLKKKFNDKITFISVCLDDSVKSYRDYLKTNPKQDWIILYNDKNSTAKTNYYIKGLSGFFFINPNMQLAQSPALMPSEGIEYKFNALFRPKKHNRIIGIR